MTRRHYQFVGRHNGFYWWTWQPHVLADPRTISCSVEYFWGAQRDGSPPGEGGSSHGSPDSPGGTHPSDGGEQESGNP